MSVMVCGHCGDACRGMNANPEFCSSTCEEAEARVNERNPKTGGVVELVPLGNLGNTATVTMLEEWLERARSGEVVALVLVAQTSDRCTATEHCIGEGDLAVLNFALDRMKQRLLDEDGT